MSNSLDPDQARQIVRPDLGPNCLPRLSADDTGRQRVKLNGCQHIEILPVFSCKCSYTVKATNNKGAEKRD